jgi:hypothetical protein
MTTADRGRPQQIVRRYAASAPPGQLRPVLIAPIFGAVYSKMDVATRGAFLFASYCVPTARSPRGHREILSDLLRAARGVFS